MAEQNLPFPGAVIVKSLSSGNRPPAPAETPSPVVPAPGAETPSPVVPAPAETPSRIVSGGIRVRDRETPREQELPATPKGLPAGFLVRRRGIDMGEQAKAAFQSGILPATRFAPVLPGIAIGAAVGGPFGALVGGGLGYLAGDLAADVFEETGIGVPLEKQPEHLRAAGAFGESLLTGVTMVPPIMGLAQIPLRLGSSYIGKMFDGVFKMARDQPGRFLAGEMSSLVQASAAGAAATAADPNVNPLVRAGVEGVVGALNPTRLIAKYWQKVQSGLMNAVRRLSPAGRRTRAGQILTDFLLRDPDKPVDIDALSKVLSETEIIAKSIPGFRGSAAMLTGSPRLAAVEAELARIDEPFGATLTQMANESSAASANAIALLQATGDPQALRVAAQMLHDRYSYSIERLLQHAQSRAVQMAENVGRGATLAQRSQLSIEITELHTTALRRARTLERELWEKALPNPGQSAAWNSVIKLTAKLRGELAVADELPVYIETEMRAIAWARSVMRRANKGETTLSDGTPIRKGMIREAQRRLSVGELFRYRSGLLARARGSARSTSDLADRDARYYSLAADAALADMILTGVATREVVGLGRGGKSAGETSFDMARRFSRELHDTFTRSFVGEARQEGGRGLRVPPEVMLKKAFATGDEAATLRLKELQDAVDFVPAWALTAGVDDMVAVAKVDSNLMMDAQSRLLRIMADQAIDRIYDPKTNREIVSVNLARARRFLEQAGEVLGHFPAVRDDLLEAVKSEKHLQRWVLRLDKASRRLDGGSVIGQVLKVESAVDAVGGALVSKEPVGKLTAMLKMAREAGPEAEQGFSAAVWEYMLSRASKNLPEGKFSLRVIADMLHEPMRPGLPSLRDWLISENLMPKETVQRLEEVMEAATRVTVAATARAVGEKTLDEATMLEVLIARGGGSEITRRILKRFQPAGTGATTNSLIVATAGARAAQNLMHRLPNLAVKEILKDALVGKPLQTAGVLRSFFAKGKVANLPVPGASWSLLNKLLKTPATPEEALKTFYMLHAYAWQAGFLGAEDSFEDLFSGDPGRGSGKKGSPSRGFPEGLPQTWPEFLDLDEAPEDFDVDAPEPDASLPQPDASLPQPGASLPQPGASLPQPGASLPQPGATISPPGPGGAVIPGEDRSGFRTFEPTPEQEKILMAVQQAESDNNPRAVSAKGADGLMQVMKATAADPGFRVAPARDNSDEELRRVGREYFLAMLERYEGNLEHAAAAYNWGWKKTDRWIARGANPKQLPFETRQYIRRIKKNLGMV